jgi:hypothetical protein
VEPIPKARLFDYVRHLQRPTCLNPNLLSTPLQQFSANAAYPCRTARTNAVGLCRQAPQRSRQHWTRTQTVSSATSSSRSAGIQFPASRWYARGFRCPGRICHNEIRRSAWPQRSQLPKNLKLHLACLNSAHQIFSGRGSPGGTSR